MASTYGNNLRLEEIGSGEQSGSWGDTTNLNLEIIGQSTAWGTRAIANASTDNITIADGALDADRSLGLKLTGGGQACTITLLPNTSSKTWFMYNATAAALTFTCGSGANVIIPAGQTKVIATDGLGSGGVVHDLLTAVNLAGATVVDDLTIGGDATITGDIKTTSNATLDLAPNGTGTVVVRGNTNSGAVVFNCESNSHGQKVFGQPHSASVTNTLMLPAGANSTLVSLVSADTLTNKTLTSPKINENVAVTATATEINILDGVTSTTAELNILDGVTSTTAELNILDGVTSTASELNILDGVTTTTAEINLIDGGTARGTTAVADGDGILINDAGTMRMTTVQTVKTYMTAGVGGGTPAGAVIYHAANTAPTGFLKANGAAISRSTYSDLFAVIGTTYGAGDGSSTFLVPELRGEFLRGWDDGRGVDGSRSFGSAQGDAFKAHTHGVLSVAFSGGVSAPQAQSAGANYTTYNTTSTGGSETRPRNIALLACIKY